MPHGLTDINSIHQTFRYLLSIEVTVAELRKVCQCELRRIAQSTITAKGKSRASGKISNARVRERAGGRKEGIERDRLGDRGFDRRHGETGGRKRRSSEDEWERRRARIRAREIVEIPRFSSMRARNERENKGKKGANYWSTWRKTKDGGRGDERRGREE